MEEKENDDTKAKKLSKKNPFGDEKIGKIESKACLYKLFHKIYTFHI